MHATKVSPLSPIQLADWLVVEQVTLEAPMSKPLRQKKLHWVGVGHEIRGFPKIPKFCSTGEQSSEFSESNPARKSSNNCLSWHVTEIQGYFQFNFSILVKNCDLGLTFIEWHGILNLTIQFEKLPLPLITNAFVLDTNGMMMGYFWIFVFALKDAFHAIWHTFLFDI